MEGVTGRISIDLPTHWPQTKRESHASKLWSEYEKRRYKLLDCAERLEQRAGSKFRPKHDDDPPDKIYDIYDTLQEDVEAAKSVISSLGHEDAGWLARHIRERAVQDRDGVSREIEQELDVCDLGCRNSFGY
jgi:breast cancer 2 susceptibility protein